MAVDYKIPPWIRAPQDLAADYSAGAQLGAKIAMERERAQQDQQMAAMESQVKQQQLQDQMRQRNQELQVDTAYKQEQLRLKQKDLELAQQDTAMKTQVAARKFAAQQKFQQLVQSGVEPDQAALQIGPELFSSMAGFAGAAREVYQKKHPFIPTSMTLEGQKLIQESPNRWSRVPSSATGGPLKLQPLLDPSGKPIPGAAAYPSSTGAMRPYTFPKIMDPNDKDIKALETGLFGDYLTGRRDEPEKPSKSYLAAKKRYAELKAAKAGSSTSTGGVKRYRYDPKTKKFTPMETTVTGSTTTGTDTTDSADTADQ